MAPPRHAGRMHRLVRRLALLPSIARRPRRPRDRRPAGARRGRLPDGLARLPHVRRDGRRRPRRSPRPTRRIVRTVLDRRELPGPRAAGRRRSATTSRPTRPSPRSCIDGLHHADEHMGLEMTLRILHWLADGYGTDARITDIVNTREVWIVFAVNPDGAAVRHQGSGRFHYWRKNRQPNAGLDARSAPTSTATTATAGAAPAGRARNPPAITYHGAARVLGARDPRRCATSSRRRVVGGRQQIRAAITFHESGRLVMWPYGYTTTERPVRHDEPGPRALARRSAGTWRRRNGYKPEQASDLYVSVGHDARLGCTARTGCSRTRSRCRQWTTRRTPRSRPRPGATRRRSCTCSSARGARWRCWARPSATARCGAFDDDLEVARGWTVNPDGTDTAPASGPLGARQPVGHDAVGRRRSSRRRRRPGAPRS